LLDSPEIASLVPELEATRWTGRPGYPIRSMIGMALAKSIYRVPTWTRTVALVREHAAFRAAVVGSPLDDVPSVFACYRFAGKLRVYSAPCLQRHARPLHRPRDRRTPRSPSRHGRERRYRRVRHARVRERSALPLQERTGARVLLRPGRTVGPPFSGQHPEGRRLLRIQDRRRGLHGKRAFPSPGTCAPQAKAETTHALPLIDAARERGFAVSVAIADKGYDNEPFHTGCMDRGIAPITPLRETPAVKRGEHRAPSCEHGDWTFSGADYKRRATKWRCPTGECQPASAWIKADRLHPLIPRDTDRSRKLYRSRGAVEREFGRLKHEWALLPLRVRGLDRVRLHADLTILAKLACALSRARGVPVAV
jgi:hypothetical protein